MTSNSFHAKLPPMDTPSVRRHKKRGIAAKLAEKDRRQQSDNDSIIDIFDTDKYPNDSNYDKLDSLQDYGCIERLKDVADLNHSYSSHSRSDDNNIKFTRRLLRPSVSDVGVGKSVHIVKQISENRNSNSVYNDGPRNSNSVYNDSPRNSNSVYNDSPRNSNSVYNDSPRNISSDHSILDVKTTRLRNGKNVSPESTISRFRSLKMSPDVKLTQYKHVPTPPTTPRQTAKRVRDPYSSDEHDVEYQKPKPTKRSSLVTESLTKQDSILSTDSSDHIYPIVIDKRSSHSRRNSQPDPSLNRLSYDTNSYQIESDKYTDKIDEDKIENSHYKNAFELSENLLPAGPDHNDINDISTKDNSSLSRSNRLSPLTPPSHTLPPLPFDVSSRALRTAYKSENSTTRDILLERMESLGENKSADSMSDGSNSGLPVIFTQQVRNKGINLNASSQSNSSLLGCDELCRYLPDRKLNIFIGSWNMCEIKTCPLSMDDFILPNSSRVLLDMYVIGTQENAMNKKEWEIQLQETLGLSHVLLYSATHNALHIVVFIRRDLMWFCSGLDWDCVSTRAITVVKTKGAVAISFTFFGTSFLFVNSHLTCDSNKTKHRMADYEKIIRELKLPKGSTNEGSILTRYDCIFWCGDLNFRIDKGRSNVDVMLGHLNTQDHPNFESLIDGDQLYKYICEGRIFQDFQEGRITFSPTYKFDIDSDKYDTSSKMRIPSYTDRVLFRSKVKSSITCVCYDAVMDIKVSDHRPVYAQFQACVRPAVDGYHNISELKFDKAVYIEASKRRGLHQQMAKRADKSSAVCAVM